MDWTAKTVTLDVALRPGDFHGLEVALGEALARLVPATLDERKVALGQLLLVLPMPPLDEHLKPARWAAYHKALAALPFDVLTAACAAIITTATFYPKPSEILAASSKAMQERYFMLSRLKAFKTMRVVVEGEDAKEDPAKRARVLALWRAQRFSDAEQDPTGRPAN